MKIPSGMTEEQVIKLIYTITSHLSVKFRFGYLSQDDIQQECFILAIDGLERYDETMPLENFLRVHIKNRLCNLKRKYQRRELQCVCKTCSDKTLDVNSKMVCIKYKQWYDRNLSKKNIMLPIGIDEVSDEHEKGMRTSVDLDNKIYQNDIFQKIDNLLPVDMRADYIKIKNGIKVSKSRYDKIVAKIQELLNVGS
jgi:DNA-directed RNA polymerase specialized sigma24 family protein